MNPNIHETIDAYLNNTLSTNERARFEQAMAADEELAAEVAVFQLEQEGQELLIERDLRDKMQRWKTEPQLPQPPSVRRRLWWWLVGAGLLCISGLLWYQAQPTAEKAPPNPVRPAPSKPNVPPSESVPVAKNQSPPLQVKSDSPLRVLALAAYNRPDFSETFRNADTTKNTNQDLQRILDAWKNKQPDAVIKAAALVSAGSPHYFRVQEILAHACLESAQYGRAQQIFDGIAAASLGAESEHAEWYGLLCLLAQSRANEARKRLDILLADEQHIRHEDARRLEKQWIKK